MTTRPHAIACASAAARSFHGTTTVSAGLLTVKSGAALSAATGGSAIKLELASVGGETCIRVGDTGRGIASEHHEEVFKPFRRLEADRGTPGAGLGLALVGAIAARHHARIVLSDNAPGLMVEVTFPRTDAAPVAAGGELTAK